MKTNLGTSTVAAFSDSDGIFINTLHDTTRNFRVCKILNTEIRVWGSYGPSLGREIINALRQIVRFAQPTHPVALMADYHPAHFGVVGSVTVSSTIIAPDLIGGDCGCGVYAARLQLNSRLLHKQYAAKLMHLILKSTPVGKAQNRFLNARAAQLSIWQSLEGLKFISKRELGRLKLQLGSLGSGNHFIEIAEDCEHQLWLLVHSGSRFLGGLLRNFYYQQKLLLAEQKSQDFLQQQNACLQFAALSRREIAMRCFECIQQVLKRDPVIELEIDQPHNFVEMQQLNGEQVAIHRKGACAARADQWLCIPGNMASGACIVQGKNNPDSYASSSHGAGRVLSRGEAFRELSYKDLQREMQNVTWSKSRNLIDEAPAAYKKLEHVMRAQADLVRVNYKLRPIISVKGDN